MSRFKGCRYSFNHYFSTTQDILSPLKLIFYQDKYLRSVADYRNLQERTKREVKAARDFALQRFATDLLESLDNIDRALGLVDISAVPGSSPSSSPSPPAVERLHKDLQNLHSGLQMTQQVLLQTLRRHGLEPFDPAEAAESFDPNKHEAMFQAPQDGKKDGSVFHTQQKGYVLNGRILRVSSINYRIYFSLRSFSRFHFCLHSSTNEVQRIISISLTDVCRTLIRLPKLALLKTRNFRYYLKLLSFILKFRPPPWILMGVLSPFLFLE